MSNIEETPPNTSDTNPIANPTIDTMESLIEEFSPKEILESCLLYTSPSPRD